MSTQKGILQKLSNSIKNRPSELISDIHDSGMHSFERTKKLEFDEDSLALDRDEEVITPINKVVLYEQD